MSFLEEMHKPDILDCISHLSSDEVFTPPRLVNEILDTLPQELFKSSKTKFLDPCCKSGVFLREIAKRLIEGLKDEIPDLEKRIDHIFKNQLYGLAITELTALLSRRSVYCSKTADGEYSVCKFSDSQGNIEYKRTYHVWFKDKCMMCGASKSEYDRGEELETHAYSFIHADEQRNSALFKRLKEMKFDVIIGNPPYQLSDGGNGASAKPLYHLFVEQAKKLNPRYITMIIPSRWYSGGKGLDDFRSKMIKDKSIRVLCDYFNSSDCFPGVDLSGGVCYFLWDRDNKGDCNVITCRSGQKNSLIRPLIEEGLESFIRFNEAVTILNKVRNKKEKLLIDYISSRKPFGISTSIKPEKTKTKEYDVKIYAYPNNGYINQNDVLINKNWLSKYKVFIAKAYGERGDFPYLVIGKPFLGEPNSCSSETYLVCYPTTNKCEAENCISYLKTRFARFLILLTKNTQNAAKGVYQFVPLQDFSEEWTDEKLYKKYGLTQEEIDFIESMIRPME